MIDFRFVFSRRPKPNRVEKWRYRKLYKKKIPKEAGGIYMLGSGKIKIFLPVYKEHALMEDYCVDSISQAIQHEYLHAAVDKILMERGRNKDGLFKVLWDVYKYIFKVDVEWPVERMTGEIEHKRYIERLKEEIKEDIKWMKRGKF